MAENKYPIQQKLADLKRSLDSDPTNVELAHRYWLELASLGGRDIRSGGFVIEAFRGCALVSLQGVIAFAHAYRELFEKSGEKPRPELFDGALFKALKTRLPALSNGDQDLSGGCSLQSSKLPKLVPLRATGWVSGIFNAAPEALLTSEGSTVWVCLPSNKGRSRSFPLPTGPG